MTEIGYVISVDEEYASVIFKRKSGCGDNCATCKAHCESASITTDIRNTLGAKTGDRVKVEMRQDAFNKMILWAYVFPLIMLSVGIVIGINLFKSLGYANYEILSFILGIAALTISYIALHFVNKKAKKSGEYVLQMVEIVK